MKIHKTAIVESNQVGNGTEIGPFAVIEEGATIGVNCRIHSHTVISSGVVLGDGVEVFPGAFIGKEPKGAGVLARQPIFDKIVNIGDNCSIGPNSVIYYDVSIGNNCLIGDGASIREKTKIDEKCIIGRSVCIGYACSIGYSTRIMDGSQIVGNCKIGNHVFISILVGTSNDNSFGSSGYNDKMQGPEIKDYVTIGVGATLLPNIIIGENAIVGAGSVVTKSVVKNSKVIGVPARMV